MMEVVRRLADSKGCAPGAGSVISDSRSLTWIDRLLCFGGADPSWTVIVTGLGVAAAVMACRLPA
ncbi:hypothetical protein C666_09045 [Thauera linaloolentis 47Lol = DSM 12138]|uniref:Uncharacterized protein n=1 Tax=Thauera linaloolentis (strain DSM 12138 / JCM 21573 / CCUG 41526 / CIP 105981 / IAM 15112 / NBRC 102519 / 47Lol) TaxID=1123367 RepID=N6Z1Q7_THAL4|nr:hypothetical protein C666_09045 [Thauera linaloolentis 47Lol = DSM 12138]